MKNVALYVPFTIAAILTACGSSDGEAVPSATPDGGDASANEPGGPDGSDDGDGSVLPGKDGGVIPTTPTPPVPMPLRSRGKRTATSSGTGGAVVDGTDFGGNMWDVRPTATKAEWVSIEIGAGPTRLMLSWISASNGGYMQTAEGAPKGYRIETSASSTNGTDGTWTAVATVTGNVVKVRAHAFDFTGQKWVRFTVTEAAADAGGRVTINEIDVHDASQGTSDTWMFAGDSITAGAFNRSYGASNFAERIKAAKPAYYPLIIPAGTGGTTSADMAKNVDAWLAANPDIQNWCVSYGTNDSASQDPKFATQLDANLRAIVKKLVAAKKIVFIPRIPYSKIGATALPAYNAVVDKVIADFKLNAGPDLFAFFKANQTQLGANGTDIHPNDEGYKSMNRLWAETVLPLYR